MLNSSSLLGIFGSSCINNCLCKSISIICVLHGPSIAIYHTSRHLFWTLRRGGRWILRRGSRWIESRISVFSPLDLLPEFSVYIFSSVSMNRRNFICYRSLPYFRRCTSSFDFINSHIYAKHFRVVVCCTLVGF